MKRFLIFLSVFFIFSCSGKDIQDYKVFYALDTVCRISLYDQGTDEIYKAIEQELLLTENLFNSHITNSEISKINSEAGKNPVIVSPETFNLVQKSIELWKSTEGAFNPALGPVISLWKIGSENPVVPDSDTIAEKLSLCNPDQIIINNENLSIFLNTPGMALDLGGIAKGFCAEQIKTICISEGITKGIIDLGGNIILIGEKKPGYPWTAGIRTPEENTFDAAISFSCKDKSIVTSGIYERFFIKDGVLYHHIFNPETGFPVENRLLSVSVISENSITADALSTAIFVMGLEKGMEYVKKIPGTEAVFITKENEIFTTAGIRENIIFVNPAYKIKDF